jgi:hypothetical protein
MSIFGQRMLIYVIVVYVVHVIVMQVAGVIVVLDGFVTARLTMLVLVLLMCLTGHKILSVYFWFESTPIFLGIASCLSTTPAYCK